ncbi:hypothetical protein [uncultured Draconibacterium sp.]|uniref:hypothetical protein n=1 Tax=uncultured Draconibacterium sp. TaxID=1573823 RepID=UPI003260D976
MRKINTLLILFLLSVSAAFAQPELPSGYVSVYSINSETELAPLAVEGGASTQLLGPASGWGEATDYDFSDYTKLAVKITFDAADAGHDIAIRFSVNATGAKLHKFTLPNEGTSFVAEIDLAEYADEAGKVLFGGIVFYNGASHWSFTYDGTAATQACTIEYVALQEKLKLPAGYVSVYSINDETEKAPIGIDGGASYQLLGPAQGWGESTDYDFSDYEKLAVKITFDAADAGNDVAIRFSVNATGAKLHKFTLPSEGTSFVAEIDLAEYANEEGQVLFGGIVFYNGASHWSFSYDGTAATQACTVDYVALKEKLKLPEGYVSVYSVNDETEKAPLSIDGGASYQLLGPASGWGESTDYDFSNYEKLAVKVTFDPADAGHDFAIRFSVNATGAKLHKFTLPNEGNTFVAEIDLAEYADDAGKVLFGGIVFYNGASHWSFSYDGTAATQACTIDYVALQEKGSSIPLPQGYVSYYSINAEEERAPVVIEGGAALQLGGPADWGNSTQYDLSNYEALAFKISYDPADAGNQVAIRFNINGSVKLHIVTLPAEDTSVVEVIDITQYADEDGTAINGGIFFYNGATHWSFAYDGTAATQACRIDYIALKEKLKLPEGYVSVYSINEESERAPISIDGGASLQLIGPANGWGEATDYDFSNFEKLVFNITFDPADAGNDIAIRFSVNNTGAKLHKFTLPTEGTEFIAEIDLTEYADGDGNILFGGIVFYNGASHWSFSYDGTAATQACTINYVALKEKPEIDPRQIPEGYISIYSLKAETELAPRDLAAGESFQLLGSADNWGSSMDYDLTNYETLAVQVAYDSINAGKEVALRFSVDGWTYLHLFTLPVEGDLVMEEIYLADYANANGEVLLGGIVFYNGASHWSFLYTEPSTEAVTIDFVALKPSILTGIPMVRTKDPNALVNVYSITGAAIRLNVKRSEATRGLKQGLYLVGREKVYVTH